MMIHFVVCFICIDFGYICLFSPAFRGKHMPLLYSSHNFVILCLCRWILKDWRKNRKCLCVCVWVRTRVCFCNGMEPATTCLRIHQEFIHVWTGELLFSQLTSIELCSDSKVIQKGYTCICVCSNKHTFPLMINICGLWEEAATPCVHFSFVLRSFILDLLNCFTLYLIRHVYRIPLGTAVTHECVSVVVD